MKRRVASLRVSGVLAKLVGGASVGSRIDCSVGRKLLDTKNSRACSHRLKSRALSLILGIEGLRKVVESENVSG